jgi:hypothetical protein
MAKNQTFNEAEFIAACLLQGDSGGAHIQFGDSAVLDGNGRLRTAPPQSVFNNKNIHSKNSNLWEEPITGAIIVHGTVTGGPFQIETITGGTSGTIATVTAVDSGALTVTYTVNHNGFTDGETITGTISGATAAVTTHNTGSDIYHTRANASAVLQIGESVGDKAIRQSHKYIPYREGKNHHITETFVMDLDLGGVMSVVRRTNTSGPVVNNVTPQAEWGAVSETNPSGKGNRLDGTDTGGLNLDPTKDFFLVIDFQWQGAGRVRWGLELFGKVLYFHEESFTNVINQPFMGTPSLPVRYEVERTADSIIVRVGYFDDENGLFFQYVVPQTAGLKTIREVCTAVVSEGGELLSGLGFAESSDIVPRTVDTTLTPVMAIRLKNTVAGGGTNRKTLEFLEGAVFAVGNNNVHYHIARMHDPSGITATWTDVGGDSEAEISTDISAITGNPRNVIAEGYATGGSAGAKSTGQQAIRSSIQDQHRVITQNFDSTNSEVLLVEAQALVGTMDVFSVLDWIEYE